jgi:hypothetical protein
VFVGVAGVGEVVGVAGVAGVGGVAGVAGVVGVGGVAGVGGVLSIREVGDSPPQRACTTSDTLFAVASGHRNNARRILYEA